MLILPILRHEWHDRLPTRMKGIHSNVDASQDTTTVLSNKFIHNILALSSLFFKNRSNSIIKGHSSLEIRDTLRNGNFKRLIEIKISTFLFLFIITLVSWDSLTMVFCGSKILVPNIRFFIFCKIEKSQSSVISEILNSHAGGVRYCLRQ